MFKLTIKKFIVLTVIIAFAGTTAYAKTKLTSETIPKSNIKCAEFTFDATDSYDIDKQNLSYLWDFGDGVTSTEPVVTHVYEKGGEYTVGLTVTDDSALPCNSGATKIKVFVNSPPKASFRAPDKSCLIDTITFDADSTTDNTPGQLSYFWTFGDGKKSEGKVVKHTYSKGGKYIVILSVDDNSGTKCNTDTIQKILHVNTPPVAAAGKNISKCLKNQDEEFIIQFDGSGSKDADGDKLKYVWNFGDGKTAIGKEVSHTYSSSGTYIVKLTVNDGVGLACSKSTDAVTIELNRQPVAIAGSDVAICSGEAVKFDGSSSEAESGNLSYEWALGDGSTASGAKVTHTYEKGGNYAVTLTVDDGKGSPCSIARDLVYVEVNGKPQAVLEDAPDAGVGKNISFDASRSSDPDGDSLDYAWDFGDGTKEKSGARVKHAYIKGGSYNVTVTVDDGKGSKYSSSSDSIKIRINTQPVAGLRHIPACCVNMEQKFDASSSSDPDGDKLNYTWDLGDETTKEGVKISHVYTKPGTFRVVLIVDDGSGTECSRATDSSTIVVNAKPVPIIKLK